MSGALQWAVSATALLPKLALLDGDAQSALTRDGRQDYGLLLGAADYVVHTLCAERPTVTDATTSTTTGLTLPSEAHRSYDEAAFAATGLSVYLARLPAILDAPLLYVQRNTPPVSG